MTLLHNGDRYRGLHFTVNLHQEGRPIITQDRVPFERSGENEQDWVLKHNVKLTWDGTMTVSKVWLENKLIKKLS